MSGLSRSRLTCYKLHEVGQACVPARLSNDEVLRLIALQKLEFPAAFALVTELTRTFPA